MLKKHQRYNFFKFVFPIIPMGAIRYVAAVTLPRIICFYTPWHYLLFIPVTRRVKGYARLVGKYVTGRRKRFRPRKVYIFLIRITSQVGLAMSVCPYER